MHQVVTEFETTRDSISDSYGDVGCRLSNLKRCAFVLRHERYTNESLDSIYLFARAPEIGAQVFIKIFPAGPKVSDWQQAVTFYEKQRKEFKLPAGQVFDATFLAPAATGFGRHDVFRTRDGKTRRRVVHVFTGEHRNVMVVYSHDSSDLLASPFLTAVSTGLVLQDVPVGEPFLR